MLMKVFGNDKGEQLRGIAGFVIVFSLVLVAVVLVVAPIMGDKTSETRISVEIVKVLIGLVGTAFGFLLGQSSKGTAGGADD